MKKKAIMYIAIFTIFLFIVGIVLFNYRRLNLITGFAAKHTCSCSYIARYSMEQINSHYDEFAPVKITKNVLDKSKKIAYSSVYGLKKRTATYEKDLGCLLLPEGQTNPPKLNKPVRDKKKSNASFPYGNAEQKDTVFENIDYLQLKKAVDNAFSKDNKSTAVLVIYKNQIIAEQYTPGYDKNSIFLGWSMTKSIMGSLWGVYSEQNNLDIYKPAPVKEWKNDKRSKITIHNLLQMNSGLKWDEDYNTICDVTKMLFLSKDMASVQINKELKYNPNTHWKYSSGTTNLLSELLKRQFSSKQEYMNFCYRELIDRIGMHSMILETDYQGTFVTSSYGWATARDWSKFGLLYLNKGNWKGDQIISPNWVKYSQQATPTSNEGYGAHFWLNKGGFYPDAPRDTYSANGHHGQRIYIIPSKDMVIVRLGLSPKGTFDFNAFLNEILSSVIL